MYITDNLFYWSWTSEKKISVVELRIENKAMFLSDALVLVKQYHLFWESHIY